ncbi:RNA-binding protein [Ramlibacter sp. PS3R-8]|uniref:RNA-binding protein n=1 Tax=Ramlibacter sp. PS3R-8 TaxID=3133437 RepID=UPI0030A05264
MKPFQLDPGMRTMRGVFYPTGWLVLMFAGEQQAREAAKLLSDQGGVADTDVLLVTPEDFRRDIVGATGDDDILPSAGTEGDTVRKFAQFAREGHYGLMVHAPKGDDSDRIVELLRGSGITFGQKYRHLVIEDVEA